jgi:hypothetical protein
MPDPLRLLDSPLAFVNADIVTASELRELIEPAVHEAEQTLQGTAFQDKLLEIKAAAINELVTRKLILQQARSEELKVAESDIDERLEQAINAQSAGDQTSFLRGLTAHGYTLQKFRERLRDDIAVEKMRARVVAEAKSPAEKEQLEREWLTGLQKKAFIKVQ